MSIAAGSPARRETAGFAPPAARFALGTPRPDTPPAGPEGGSDRESATGEGRPSAVFGQRYFATAGLVADLAFPAYQYCHVRQVAVTDDGEAEPLIRRLSAWDKTTTGSSDSKDKLQEEWTMDFLR